MRNLEFYHKIRKIRLEKSEMEEDFLQKLNLLRASLEKSSINDRFREVLVKSEDFGAFFREFSHKKACSLDKFPEKSEETAEIAGKPLEKLTFRRFFLIF